MITTETFHLPPQGTEHPFLSCRVAGPKDAPLLLFLHGFPEAAFVWDGLMARFADRYRCVAPNLRGYPGSYAPADVKAYRANVVLGDLIALISQIGAQTTTEQTPAAAVIAHDWGGALAWGLAAVAPASMQRLVILNAPHPGLFLKALRDDPAQQAASAYMNLLRTPDIEARLSDDDFAQMWPFFERFGGATWLTPSLKARYREAWSAQPASASASASGPAQASASGTRIATSALTGPLNYYRASPLHPPISPQDAIHTLQLPDALVHVKVPTSVVWGEADTALPPSLLDGLADYVADLHVTRLPHATHWLVHEAPDEVAQAIEAALAR
jgi:pimeloyl-ACP methyl ester carboxylesterase